VSLADCSSDRIIRSILDEVGVVRPLEGWVERWATFVGRVESGYTMTIYDYTNDLGTRRVLDQVIGVASPACRDALERTLGPIDARYFAATTEPSERDPMIGRADRWYRYPLLLVGELRDDLEPFLG
jgi:hypothetical protein